ncbi:stealth conserved region 3 domain-containing protein [Streptomyces sp. TLI_171]|uniref:stealth conserved region 3 domain-containing protein n=1 Tax=Streptomyces sp. TLI_171 TaxID=1938859 RepID=UPI000C17E16C|nr:stealth conserved region 3 domain-containing protein [Streptomyces sp. TLI_171]RKE19458.1 Stealth-like protein [Streptomyces sp. TLI_171]
MAAGRAVMRPVRRFAARTLRAIGLLPQVPPPAPAPIDPQRLREDELIAADPALVRHLGQLTEVRDDLLAPQARQANLIAVAEALDAAGLPYLLIPDRGVRHRLGVRPGGREAALAAVAAAFRGAPVYAALLGHGRVHATVLAEGLPAAVEEHETPPPPAEAPEGEQPPLPPEPPERVKGVRLYRPVVTTGRTLHYGQDHGCDLEFWDATESQAGGVASIDETPYGWWLPSLEAAGTVRVGDREYPVAEPFLHHLPEDVRFPVDAVLTWVDDTDPQWQRRRAEARARLSGAAPETADRLDDGDHRYRNHDELRYCLRSIAMYAPWIRHLYLVTDDQVPAWLDEEAPGLTVVAHRDLLPAGPVFNSHAIETGLHRIPGLSEHFLYFNDDMFLGRPVRPEDFFLGNGQPKVFRDTRIVPPSTSTVSADVYTAAQQNTRRLLESRHGRAFVRVLAHVPYALRRSLLAEAERRWQPELATTGRSVFRAAVDVAPVTLALYHAQLCGDAVDGVLRHAYLAVDRAEDRDRLARLLADRDLDAFCLADGDAEDGPAEEQGRALAEFLTAYFPVPGPFETPVRVVAAPEDEGPDCAPAFVGLTEPEAEATAGIPMPRRVEVA